MTDASLLFVGTATTVLRYAGFTLLTDPNFLHRGSPLSDFLAAAERRGLGASVGPVARGELLDLVATT